MANDLYQTPAVDVLLKDKYLDPESLRDRHSRDEVIVLAVGWFYYFFGGLLAGIGLFLLGLLLWKREWMYFVASAVCSIVGAVYIITGFGLRRFDSWARVPSLLAAIVAVVIPPAGTLAGVVCFFLLKKHALKEMFTARYQTAIITEGEVNRHFGWLGIMGGVLSGVTMSLIFYLFSKGVF